MCNSLVEAKRYLKSYELNCFKLVQRKQDGTMLDRSFKRSGLLQHELAYFYKNWLIFHSAVVISCNRGDVRNNTGCNGIK